MAGYGFHDIPADVFKFVREEQDRIKKEKGTNQFSFACTVYRLLREHKKHLEQNKTVKQV